jgi:hypothetical protein
VGRTLVVVVPPVPVNEMTVEERRTFAETVVDAAPPGRAA